MHLGEPIPDGGFQSEQLSGRRSRIFHQLRTDLNRHPGISVVELRPCRDGKDRRLVGTFDTDIFVDGLVAADEATIYVNWWPHPPGYDDQFKFHYTESSGYDCGWHRQPHEDSSEIPFDHFQQRPSPDDEYQYRSVDFGEDTPTGILWEITSERLPRTVRSRYDPEFKI